MPTVLITGAGRGLGEEFVTQFMEDGWDIIATCRNPDDIKAVSYTHLRAHET